MSNEDNEILEASKMAKIARGALQVASGLAPFLGGFLSAIAGAWSEKDQDKVNRFFAYWMRMMQDEFKEKEKTVAEVMARLDLQDEKISKRLESNEYQSLIRKTFREWGGAESEEKRVLIRNILVNAASADITSDDVIRLFLDWIKSYSELHFHVIGAIYNASGITRRGIWQKIGKGVVREDSADADLYKLLIRDLSTGGVIRQHRETDYYGNFIKKPSNKGKMGGFETMKSAFDDEEEYELTQIGKQFVHYAMTELPPKIEFHEAKSSDQESGKVPE
jgi:hypothetical protein